MGGVLIMGNFKLPIKSTVESDLVGIEKVDVEEKGQEQKNIGRPRKDECRTEVIQVYCTAAEQKAFRKAIKGQSESSVLYRHILKVIDDDKN